MKKIIKLKKRRISRILLENIFSIHFYLFLKYTLKNLIFLYNNIIWLNINIEVFTKNSVFKRSMYKNIQIKLKSKNINSRKYKTEKYFFSNARVITIPFCEYYKSSL